jgi:GTP-binding protein Era
MPIKASIIVEKESQKGIVIGANGKRIKLIGTRARNDIEALLKKHVYLELFVKVQKDWRNEEKALETFGYKLEK